MEEAHAAAGCVGGGTGCAVLLWKRRGQVIRATWVADQKWAVRMRARETELAWAARESERTVWSGRGRPGGSAAQQESLYSLYFKLKTFLSLLYIYV